MIKINLYIFLVTKPLLSNVRFCIPKQGLGNKALLNLGTRIIIGIYYDKNKENRFQ